jgi:hypothetical protein
MLIDDVLFLTGRGDRGNIFNKETPMTLLKCAQRLDYSPDQPRDENGQFGEGSGTHRDPVVRGMPKPTFEIQKLGPARFELIVRNSGSNPQLHAELERLGYKLTEDIANRHSVIVTSPAEMDAMRNPIKKYFVQG